MTIYNLDEYLKVYTCRIYCIRLPNIIDVFAYLYTMISILRERGGGGGIKNEEVGASEDQQSSILAMQL